MCEYKHFIFAFTAGLQGDYVHARRLCAYIFRDRFVSVNKTKNDIKINELMRPRKRDCLGVSKRTRQNNKAIHITSNSFLIAISRHRTLEFFEKPC